MTGSYAVAEILHSAAGSTAVPHTGKLSHRQLLTASGTRLMFYARAVTQFTTKTQWNKTEQRLTRQS
jgi:hypothetical protein